MDMNTNTFFNNAKRIVMVLMILSFSTLMYGGGIHFDNHTSKVTLDMSPSSGAGDVYIHYTSFTKDDVTSEGIDNYIEYKCKDAYDGWVAFSDNDTHVHYILAVESPVADDYLWDGWYAQGSTTPFSEELSTQTPPIDATQNGGTVEVTYTAKWLLPKVIGVKYKKAETITNQNALTETIDNKDNLSLNILFDVEEAKADDNFNYTSTGDDFVLMNKTASPESYPTQIDMQVQYTPNGIHTASDPTITKNNNYTTSQHTQTITSKYKGTSTATSQTFTWTVKEDYTPRFTMAYSECVFAKVPIGEYGTTIAEGSISPNTTNWNYAASQAYPTLDDGSDIISPDDDFLRDGCIWKIKLSNNDDGYFTINKTKLDEEVYYEVTGEELTSTNQTIIRFSPPENAKDKDEFTATLHVTCAYYDAIGNIIEAPEEKTIKLKGQALLEEVVLINNSEEAEITFDNVVCGAPLKYSNNIEVTSKTATYITNISNITSEIIGSGKDYFEIDANKENKLITVTLKDNVIPGTHQARLTITGTYEDDETHETRTKTATLGITANVILANPVLTGYAENNKDEENGEAVLSWTPIAGATSYTLYYTNNDNIEAGSGKAVDCGSSTSISIPGLPYNSTYSFIVVAKYNTIETVSNKIILHPTDFPETIVYASRVTPIYTGTDHEGENHPNNGTFPYSTKRQVDISAAFDAETKKALFNYVVIFGLTNGHQNGTYDEVTYTNAQTPCYLYFKKDDYTYEIVKINGSNNDYQINNTNKHPYFTFDASVGSVYITGYCPYASTGSTWSENAVMHITGNGSQSFDLYLDNAEIYARSKKNATETTTASMQNVFPNFSTTTGGYMQGSGAVLAFTSTSGTFRPKVHLLGENVLQSCEGMTLEGEYYSKEGSWPVYYENSFSGTYTQASSPIQALPTNLNSSVIMTIDNKWETSLTAGRLELRVYEGSTAPLIDLGNEYSKVIFEGGYIVLQNIEGRNIASYRQCVRTDSQVSTNKGDVSQTRTIYGASKAIGSGKNGTKSSHDIENKLIALTTDNGITFNDGTFNATHPITVPATTEVNGGSYNCTFAHSPIKNRYGKEVKKIELSTNTIASDIATIANELIIFKDGIVGFKKWMDKIYPEANWKDSESPVHYASVSIYYDGANKTYGYSSLMPDADGKVYLMLPKDGTPTIKQWAIAGPSFDVTTHDTQSGTSTIHCTVQKEEENTFGKTHKMLYFETDTYTKKALEGEGYDLSFGGSNVKISSNLTTPAEITNKYEYVISDKVYIMKPIVATDWMLFCPPFDVANVYIVEAYPEKQLIADFKGVDDKVTIKGETNIANARKAQSQRFMDLYLWWYNHGEKQGGSDDFYDGNNLGSFVYSWAEHEAGGNANYIPVINQLYHYTGHNGTYPEGMKWYDAHYYLYESVGSWTAQNGDYKPTWKEVTTQSGNNAAIMKAGKVYALNFPYNVIGGHNPETTWDYWTGKYIIIESTVKANGHTIPGTSYDWQGIKTIDESTAWMCGNPTFASSQVTDANNSQIWQVDPIYGYTQIIEDPTTGELDTTICVNSYQMVRQAEATLDIYPTRGFVLADPIEPSGMRARTINYQTGEVTYETIEGEDDNDDPGVSTSIPTIMGDVSILVIPTDEGLSIIPREPQQVMLYNAEGKLLFSQLLSAEEHINVPTGAYIVRGEHNQVKAIKK